MSLLITALLSCASVSTPADVEACKASARFRTHLRDGTVVTSVSPPVIAFGAIRHEPRSGDVAWLDLSEVNLELSRTAWSEAAPWHALDRSALHGARLTAEPGYGDWATRVFTPSRTRPVVIEIWATWCVSCRANLGHLAELWESAPWRDHVDVMTVCVGTDRHEWQRAVQDLDLPTNSCWANLYETREDAPALERSLDGKAGTTLLVSPDGLVIRSDIRHEILAAVVAASTNGSQHEPGTGRRFEADGPAPQPEAVHRGGAAQAPRTQSPPD